MKSLKIKINNQNYIYEIINNYPKIKSGRKNYYDHYIRILKNILLTKFFTSNINETNEMFFNKFNYKINKTLIKINLDN